MRMLYFRVAAQIVTSALLIFFAVPFACAQGMMSDGMMDGYMMTPWFWLFCLLFLLLLIVAAVYAVRWFSGGNRSNNRTGGKSAIDILVERYEKGEISREEFERMKKDLE